MPKSFKNKIKYFIKKTQLRSKGVVIHNNCIFEKVNFKGKAIIEPYCRIVGEPKIIIGDHFYANAGCHFLGEITFGDDVLIGPKTVIWGRDHGTKIDGLIRKQTKVDSPIIIGNNVWIGANVTILKGVKVGDNSIIGAGSVGIKNIPKNCIVAGNPTKIIKERK